jgi:hypothetical protein
LRVKISHCWSSSPVFFLYSLVCFFFISCTSLSVSIIAQKRGFVNPSFLFF